MLPLIVLVVVAAALAFWVIGAYNGLVALKNQVANAWKQIDVQLKRRHDLIPNLVNTVKGAMQFEKDTLEAVISARNKAIAVQSAGGPTGPSVGQTAAAEGQLSGALSKLFAVVEAYPDLKATGNVAQLQEELTSTENKVAFARQAFNDAVMSYNTQREVFPNSLVAGFAGFAPAQLFEIDSPKEREAPKVKF